MMPATRKVLTAVLLAIGLASAGPAPADLIGHGGMVRAIALSPDGSKVLTASFDYTARLWDFGSQSPLGVLEGHEGPVNGAAFLPDGARAVTASDDRTAILWDLATFKPVRRFAGHDHKIMGVAVSPDGTMLATAAWDKTVRLWDIASGRLVRTIAHASPLNAVVFAAGGTAIVAGDHNGLLAAWNVATGALLGKMEGHERGITQLAVSPDGGRVLSASIDKTVRLWDVATQREFHAFAHHEAPVYAVAFAPDGKDGLSAGREGFLVRWNLADGKIVRQIRAHDRNIWSVAVTPDGRFAVTGASDEAARVWHLGTGDRIGIQDDSPDEPKPWLTSSHPGAKLFTKCARCHAVSANGPKRSGPHLAGLFGRRAGSVADYNYSAALTGATFEWNEETLFDLFHRGPDVMLPGTKMPVQRVPNDEQLRQLIAYLKELTAAKPN